MSLSKKKRFNIFERDNFTCSYCGEKPPKAILEVDHIISKKDNGGDNAENLTTSCFDCNRGKSKKSLSPEDINNISFKDEIKKLEVQKEQMDLYFEFLKKKNDSVDIILDKLCERYCELSDNQYELSRSGMKALKSLYNMYPLEDVYESLQIAWENNRVDIDEKIRYTAGILKQKRLQRENPDQALANSEIKKAMSLFYESWNKNRRVYLNHKVKEDVERYLTEDIDRLEDITDIVKEVQKGLTEGYSSYSIYFQDKLNNHFN